MLAGWLAGWLHSCSSGIFGGVSICKWCISGREMLLMIYLHLALIYANVFFPLFPSKYKYKNEPKKRKGKEKKVPHGSRPWIMLSLNAAACWLFNFSCRRSKSRNYYGIFLPLLAFLKVIFICIS